MHIFCFLNLNTDKKFKYFYVGEIADLRAIQINIIM